MGYDVPHQLLTDIVAWEGEEDAMAEQLREVASANAGDGAASSNSSGPSGRWRGV